VVGRDRVGQQPVVRAPQRLGRLLAELRALRGRTDEVGEEDRGGAGVRPGRLGGNRPAVYVFRGLRGKEGLLARWGSGRRVA